MSSGGPRVSIPNSVRKTIDNIKEITGNHSDEEIYAMLKECSMDPNETTQKLLLQDTFHEVKSKRERRKENANNRESVESKWKTGVQGRGGRGGRINSSPRYNSHDAGGGRNPGSGKENGVNQIIEKGVSLSLPTSQEIKNKDKISVPSSAPVENCATNVASGGVAEITSSLADISGKGSALPPVNANKNPTRAFGTRNSSEQPTPKSDNSVVSITLASPSSALSSSSSEPSNELQLPGVDASKCDGGTSSHPNEPSTVNHVETNLNIEAMEISNSLGQENQPVKSHKIEESQLNEISPPSVSTHGGSLVNPPSNYNKRPQQVIGPHKVNSNKEWKPKTTSSVVIQQSRAVGAAAASEVPADTFEATDLSLPASRVLDSEEATFKLQKKLEELHISKSQLVIIPNHIQVPESERSKLSFGSFGSFGTGFGVSSTVLGGLESDQRPTPASETSVDVDESLEEEASSYPTALITTEDVDSPERSQSPTHMPENLSPGGGDLSSSTIHEYSDLKQETGFPSGGHTNSVQTSSGYGFGFISPVVGSQISAVENSDSQGRDASRLPGFVVQPPFDPSSYYAQFYRSGDNDGRLSPFLSPGVAAKYNGNVALLPPTSSQSPQEGVVTTSPTALLTQAAGLMQSSIAVTQQPVPVFRPPAGVHISHYPPNYIPYGHYFSPFYVPPPPIHQFVGNNAFPQQPQGGNVYAPPQAATAAVKYSIPQYKMGANSGNSSHIGMPSGYGPYGSSASGFSPSTAAPAGNTTNEELGASQFKENSVYITGPQSEGSAVWIGAPGRDMSSLPANTFYNLPPQGQHLTFTPTQTGHGTFASIYHPQGVTATNVHPLLQQSQAVAAGVDTVGPGGSIYQQPQHSQINWPNNY